MATKMNQERITLDNHCKELVKFFMSKLSHKVSTHNHNRIKEVYPYQFDVTIYYEDGLIYYMVSKQSDRLLEAIMGIYCVQYSTTDFVAFLEKIEELAQ